MQYGGRHVTVLLPPSSHPPPSTLQGPHGQGGQVIWGRGVWKGRDTCSVVRWLSNWPHHCTAASGVLLQVVMCHRSWWDWPLTSCCQTPPWVMQFHSTWRLSQKFNARAWLAYINDVVTECSLKYRTFYLSIPKTTTIHSAEASINQYTVGGTTKWIKIKIKRIWRCNTKLSLSVHIKRRLPYTNHKCRTSKTNVRCSAEVAWLVPYAFCNIICQIYPHSSLVTCVEQI